LVKLSCKTNYLFLWSNSLLNSLTLVLNSYPSATLNLLSLSIACLLMSYWTAISRFFFFFLFQRLFVSNIRCLILLSKLLIWFLIIERYFFLHFVWWNLVHRLFRTKFVSMFLLIFVKKQVIIHDVFKCGPIWICLLHLWLKVRLIFIFQHELPYLSINLLMLLLLMHVFHFLQLFICIQLQLNVHDQLLFFYCQLYDLKCRFSSLNGFFRQKRFFVGFSRNCHEWNLLRPFFLKIHVLFVPKENAKHLLKIPNFVFLNGDFIFDLQF